MANAPPPERRRHARHPGDAYPLRLGRHPARLVDWSASGLGVQMKDGDVAFAVGDVVSVGIHSGVTNAVAVFRGVVQRTDPANAVVGVEIAAEAADAARLLIDLVGAP